MRTKTSVEVACGNVGQLVWFHSGSLLVCVLRVELLMGADWADSRSGWDLRHILAFWNPGVYTLLLSLTNGPITIHLRIGAAC